MKDVSKKEIIHRDHIDSRRGFLKKSGIFVFTLSSSMGLIPLVGNHITKSALAANFCPSCGAKVTPDAKFCPKCGKSIDLSGGDNREIESYEEDKHECELDLDRGHLSGYLTGPGDQCVFDFVISCHGDGINFVEISFFSSNDVDFWVKKPHPYIDNYYDKSFKEISEQRTFLIGSTPYILYTHNCNHVADLHIELIVYSKSGSGEWTGKIETSIMR